MFSLDAYVYTICMSGTRGSQKKVSDPPELGLQTVVSCWEQSLVLIQTPQVFFTTGLFLQSLTHILKRTNNEKYLSVAHVLRQSKVMFIILLLFWSGTYLVSKIFKIQM